MRFMLASMLLASITLLSSCQTGSGSTGAAGLSGNEGGSEPVNEQESYEMQKAVNRCHRTGGTRIVKIKGELKCN